MLKERRLQKIIDILEQKGEVNTNSLCKLLNVTEMTIRRDLNYLAEQKQIIRVYGGAMVEPKPPDKAIEINGNQQQYAKEKIAKTALQFIADGQKIFVDSGTTTRALANQLPDTSRNTIITNNLAIGTELASRPLIDVFMVGGELRKDTFSCYGTFTEEQIRRYRVDVAFLGAHTVGEDGFLFDSVVAEAGVKKSIIESAAKTYILIDSTKFSQYGLMSYSHVKDVTGIITDSAISQTVLATLSFMGANIIIAK